MNYAVENVSLLEKDIDMAKVFEKRSIMYIIIKRLFDIICALLGLFFMLPIALVVKIMYVCSGDFNSIFYTHTRIGKNGKKFQLYKFRSMVPNSKEMLEEMLKNPNYKKEWDENQKFEKDPRITKAGDFLRKTSLDEMPQFLNVLKNDMSLIGPRPLVPGELDSHKGNHDIYEAVKPGITSWWEVSPSANPLKLDNVKEVA